MPRWQAGLLVEQQAQEIARQVRARVAWVEEDRRWSKDKNKAAESYKSEAQLAEVESVSSLPGLKLRWGLIVLYQSGM
jgi:hypothetical protein